MNTHYTYLLIDILTIAFPLLLSFDKKVAFYQMWRYLWRGMLLTGAFFIAWDILFTQFGVWAFNDLYIIGWRIGGLPIEEWLFFIVVPYSCTFIYCCMLAYLPILKKADIGWKILLPLGVALSIAAFIFHTKAYTSSAFGLCGLALIFLFRLRTKFPAFRADAFVYTFLIAIIPFLLVNGILTALPVVIYNNQQNLGLRTYTIPFEDNFYGMLLMLGNIISLPQKK
jgi:lycopene cyclase domain-containing protein